MIYQSDQNLKLTVFKNRSSIPLLWKIKLVYTLFIDYTIHFLLHLKILMYFRFVLNCIADGHILYSVMYLKW